MSKPEGPTARISRTVTAADTAAVWGDVFPPAASTPFVLGLAEITCHAAIAESLDVGMITVGTAAKIDHRAPSKIGATLTAFARLTQRNGHRLHFFVEVTDGDRVVAIVEHDRAIVERERILDSLR